LDLETCRKSWKINYFSPNLVTTMETENPQLYGRLTSDLTAENVKAIQEIFKLGEQRNEARRSKKIEEAGGKNKKGVTVQSRFSDITFSDNL
jgi:hypothetical protein